MQYAQVAVNAKTNFGNDLFTYRILPDQLLKLIPGILVEVPFHGRKIEGIVIDLKKSLPKNLDVDKLKPIAKIIDTIPVADEIHLELAKWMSKYYLAPLGITLFENVVPVAKRAQKAISLQSTDYRQTNRQLLSARSSKPILIHADFETRMKYYLNAIHKTLFANRSTIILVPDLSFIKYFERYLPPDKLAILSSNMTLTERYLAWQDIRSGKAQIILGSFSAIFAPVKNLGLIIIDQEENDFYKSQQLPRWHAREVAEKLTDLSNAQLIFGSITPSIETYFLSKKQKYDLVEKSIVKTQTTITDLSKEKRIISYELEEAIGSTLKNHGKVILFVNRKGEGRLFSCANCGYSFLCDRCTTPLVPTKNKLICHHCATSQKTPESCPMCKSVNLKGTGITIDKVKHLLEQIFPDKKILALQKETGEDLKLDDKTFHDIFREADIIVGTFFLTKSQLPKSDLVGIVCADQSLSLPDFRIQEKAFDHLFQIIRLGKSAVVQTFTPDHAIMKALAKNSYEDFYYHEIGDRRQLAYPPFSKLIRFIYKNIDEEKCKKETQKLAQSIKQQIKEGNIKAELLGPAPAFIPNIRGQFRYHLILKIPLLSKGKPGAVVPLLSKERLGEVLALENLPKGWIIDVDPVNML